MIIRVFRLNAPTFQRFNGRIPRSRVQRTLLLIALAVVAALSVGVVPAAGQEIVQQVLVDVVLDGPAPHRIVRGRLEAAAASVAERLLVGRPLDQLVPVQGQLNMAVREVLERVTTGYAVREVSVELGVTSTVTVRLQPVEPVITAVIVAVDLRTVHPKVRPLVDGALRDGPVDEIRAAVAGLPVAALLWAGPFVEAEVRGSVQDTLPGYAADVRIRPTPIAEVTLTIVPRDSRVIRDIGVRFRSNSIPTMWLDQHTPQVISIAEPLRGLPVAFAETHRRWLAQLITAELAAYPPARQYSVVATVGLDVAETTYVNVTADSLLYRARVEAHVNIGTAAPPAAIVARIGRLAVPGVEPFVQLRLIPSTLTIGWEVGLRVEVSPSASVGGLYDLSQPGAALWATAQITRDIGVRGTWQVATQTFEGVLTYRINDFLAGEFVGTSSGVAWLRLVSNL